MATLDSIQKLLADKFDLKPEQLRPESELDKLGLDSLSIIEFMFNVEDEFKIKLAGSLDSFETYKKAANTKGPITVADM